MFKFLKEKLQGAVAKISRKIEEEGKTEEVEVPKEIPSPSSDITQDDSPESSASVLSSDDSSPQYSSSSKLDLFEISDPEPKIPIQEVPSKVEPQKIEEPVDKKGFFSSITSLFKKKEQVMEDKERDLATPPQIDEQPPQESTPEHTQAGIGSQREALDSPSNVENAGPLIEIPAKSQDAKQEQEIEAGSETPQEPIPKLDPKQILQDARPLKELLSQEPYTAIPPEPAPKIDPIPEKTPAMPVQNDETKGKQAASSTPKQGPNQEAKPGIRSIQSPQKAIASPLPSKAAPSKQASKEKPSEEKMGFFSALKERILTTTISDSQFEEMYHDLEMAMLENNVALEVIEKIKQDLKDALVDKAIRRTKVEETLILTLKSSISGLFEGYFDLITAIKGKSEKPYIIALVGINGSGKTTSVAKLASFLKSKGLSVVIAAADTFRAASIEQICLHGERLGVKVIKHDYGADPAAVAFDAIKHAQAKSVDVVLIDTAGRMNSNSDLVNEMKKIVRVAKPDLKIFVGESITGNDCVEQAKTFDEAIGIDGIILSKADIDEKGGAAVSVSYITKKPILYIGTGQEYKDLEPFDKETVMQNLGLA